MKALESWRENKKNAKLKVNLNPSIFNLKFSIIILFSVIQSYFKIKQKLKYFI